MRGELKFYIKKGGSTMKSRFIRSISSTGVWIKSLVAGAISSAAGGVILVIKDPATFNFETGLSNLLTVAGSFAIVGVANLLIKTPMAGRCSSREGEDRG
jgi:hypothetical protein